MSSKYHISAKNGSPQSDASVDQFSMSMLIIYVLMGRPHTVFRIASSYKRVLLDLKSLPSKVDQHVRPILEELKECVEVEAQLDFHALERVIGSAKKGADKY